MSFYIDKITKIDSKSNLIHNDFPDLTNNFVYFHRQMEGTELSIYENQPPLWENYEHIYDVYEDIIQNPKKFENKQITVKVPTSLIYTCDAEIAYNETSMTDPDAIGHDRLHLYADISNKSNAWLKRRNGYSPTSETIHGTIRWIFDENGVVKGFAISKDRGNARTHMAIASRGGADGDMLINLHFHKIDPKMTLSEMKKEEGGNFSEDGEERRGLDPKTKFRSGHAAEKPKYIAAAGWLSNQNIDFAGIVAVTRLRNNLTPPEFSLTSMSHLSFGVDGKQYDDFTKYKEVNINSAIKTLMKIYEKNNLGYTIQVTFVNVLSRAFYYLTSNYSDLGLKQEGEAITTRDELMKFLVWYYTKFIENYNGEKILDKSISELRRKGEDKDFSWKAFETFLVPALQAFKIKNRRVNEYRSNNPAIKAYIDSIDNSALKREAVRLIDSAEGERKAA